jgi:cytochrome d ubiquinol oxidase subunit II
MLLGATWLVMKTSGDLQERMRTRAWILGFAVVACILTVTAWTPSLQEGYYNRWLGDQRLAATITVGVSVLAIAGFMFRSLTVHRHEYVPFVLSTLLFAFCFVGLALGMYPFIVPTEITIYEAAAPRNSQAFMLVGALVLLPIILAYTGYAYWVFRGKIDPEAGYH